MNTDVVDAVVDQIGSHGVVTPGQESRLQFCPDAVAAGHQNGIRHVRKTRVEKAPKTADFAEDSRGKRFPGKIADPVRRPGRSIYVNTGIFVGERWVSSHVEKLRVFARFPVRGEDRPAFFDNVRVGFRPEVELAVVGLGIEYLTAEFKRVNPGVTGCAEFALGAINRFEQARQRQVSQGVASMYFRISSIV